VLDVLVNLGDNLGLFLKTTVKINLTMVPQAITTAG